MKDRTLSRQVSSTAAVLSPPSSLNGALPFGSCTLADSRAEAPPATNNLRTFLSVNPLLIPLVSFTSAHRVRKQERGQIRPGKISKLGSRRSTPNSQLASPLSTFRFTRLSASRPQVYLESHAYEKMRVFHILIKFSAENKALTSQVADCSGGNQPATNRPALCFIGCNLNRRRTSCGDFTF